MSVDQELTALIESVGWEMRLTTQGWELEDPRRQGDQRAILGKAWRDAQAGWMWRTFGGEDLGMTTDCETGATRALMAWSLLVHYVDRRRWRVHLGNTDITVSRECEELGAPVQHLALRQVTGLESWVVGFVGDPMETEYARYDDAVANLAMCAVALVDEHGEPAVDDGVVDLEQLARTKRALDDV